MVEPVLRTIGLTKRFGALTACDDVTIDLLPGEIHALIGPNGAGKSTLIKQIAGNLQPDSGDVVLMGETVTGLSAPIRARLGLGRTFQVSALAMEMTARENVMLGAVGRLGRSFSLFSRLRRNSEIAEISDAALDRAGLADVGDVIVTALSHGQRRQLEVAIALTGAPKAFVMDEPMAGMGAEGSRRLTGFLDELRAEAPILLVEHDMDAVFALADRVSVLVSGSIIATGTVAEIRNDPAVRQAYLGQAA